MGEAGYVNPYLVGSCRQRPRGRAAPGFGDMAAQKPNTVVMPD